MSILIKGMDMPKDCEDCRFGFYREGDSAPVCYLTKYIIIRKKAEKRHHDCPLVGIPTPHGRLIDADDIYIGRWDIDTDLAEQIQNAPTILEAEE